MALTEIAICDMALSRIGVSRQITSVDGLIATSSDSTIEKTVCEFWYERCRDRVLEDYNWTFARTFVTLVQASAGTDEIWEDEWDFAYSYPTDCVQIRRFVNDVGAGFGGHQSYGHHRFRDTQIDLYWRYEVKQFEGKRVIYTNVTNADADIEYTRRETDASLYEEKFASALAYLLASEIAVPLSVSTDKRFENLQLFSREMPSAKAKNTNEENPYDQGDGSILRARGGD